jgi:hypothetical protein
MTQKLWGGKCSRGVMTCCNRTQQDLLSLLLLYNSMMPYTCLCKTTVYVLVSSFDYRFSSEYKKSKQPGKLLLDFF